MVENNTLKVLDKTIRTQISKSGVPLKQAAQQANMSASEFLLWWANKEALLNPDQAEAFLHAYQEKLPSFIHSENKLMAVKIPSCTIEKLPERYSKNPLSFVSSSRHILSMLELKYGKLVVFELLERLQVPKEYFDNLQNRISIKFFEDLLSEYLLFGNSISEFDQLSKALFITIEDNCLQRAFPRAMNYCEAFESIQKSTKYFDENFDYEFQIEKNQVTIRCQPSEALAESMKSKTYGSKLLYNYRSHLFGNMVYACGMPPIKMQTEKCVSLGNQESVYIAKF